MFTTRYSYYINPNTKQFCQTAEGHAPITELPNFYFGDRPTFTLSFPASTFSQGDSLVAVLDNENRFLDTKQATGLNPVMTGIIHEVTAEEASASSVEIQLFDYSRKFADVINGHDNAVTCLFTIYLKSTDAEDNFTFTEIGQTLADAMPTTTSPECMWDDMPLTKYMTREEIMEVYNQFLAGLAAMTTYANLSKSYAVGGTGTREHEDTDNAKYYCEQALAIYNATVIIQNNISNLVNRIDTDTQNIERYKNEIVAASQNVSTLAEQVQNNAQQVARYKQDVALDKQSVSQMKNSVNDMNNNVNAKANEVNQAAQQVTNDKQTVQTLAGQAQNNATQAVNAKNDAQSSATSASNSASQAEGFKNQASQFASSAQTSANNANNAKNDAVAAKDAAAITEEEIREDVQEARQMLDELETRLSTAYIYGMDWKDADLQQSVAGKCIVLNNIYDNIQYDASLRYIQVESHGVLPAHNWKRCAMRTARSVNYYLHQSNSNMKADGTPAVLTGADGDILSEVDIVYFRVDKYTDSQNVNHTVWLCSDKPFNGSSPNPFFYVSPDGRTLRKQYVASFRSCVCDADGNTLNNNKTATADTTYQADKAYWTRSNNVFTKLTAGTDYTVGGTITQGSTVDTKIYENTVVASPTGFSAGRKYRSIVGALPAASATRAQFRSGHANNGFDSINFLWGSFMGIMMAIEYGTLSAQAKFSVGYSNLSEWNYKAMRLTGRTAIFGNNSGEIIADDIDANGEDYDLLTMKNGGTIWNTTAQGNHAQRVVQCSYRGIEDPFGSQFTLDDGIQKNQDAIDLSITYDGNVYLRDEADDPQTINLYCWKNPSSTKFYTTAETPEVGLNLYANTNLTTVTGTVASVGEDTITVGTTTYTRSSADDTTGHSYAWKYNESVIFSHVVNPHTDANTREVFSDSQLTTKLGNVSAVVDDYSESGYWFTQSTNMYSYLDTDRGRLKGSEYVFPATGYTGEEAVWVHHEWPKASGYYCYFDHITFFPIYRAGNWGSSTKGLCDYLYNDTTAGARVVARLGYAYSGSPDGPFYASTDHSLAYSSSYYGSRLAA